MALEAVPEPDHSAPGTRSTPRTPRTAKQALDVLEQALRAQLPEGTDYRRVPTRGSRGMVETLVVIWPSGATFFFDAEAEHR